MTLLGMGSLLVQERKWPEGQAYFEKAVKENANLAKAHHGIGLSLLNQDKVQEAIPYLSTASALDPDDYEAHYHMANALLTLGDLATAIDQYNEALRIKPDYLDALRNMGAARASWVTVKEQLRVSSAPCSSTPTGLAYTMTSERPCSRAAVWRRRSASLNKSCKWKMPRRWIWRPHRTTWPGSLQHVPTSAITIRHARCSLREAVRLDPESGTFLNTLGVAEYRAGNWNEALRALRSRSSCAVAAVPRTTSSWPWPATNWDRTTTRRWYDEGVRMQTRRGPVDPDVWRFQQEAAPYSQVRRRGTLSYMPRFASHIFVCCNTRDPSHARGCCNADGSEALRNCFQAELKKRQLDVPIRAIARAASTSANTVRLSSSTRRESGTATCAARTCRESSTRQCSRGRVIEELLIPDECLNTKGKVPWVRDHLDEL